MKCKLNGNEIESLFPCSINCPLFGDCLVQYEKESEKRSQPTNADRIRAMDDKELTEFLSAKLNDDFYGCPDLILQWLQQPAEEER